MNVDETMRGEIIRALMRLRHDTCPYKDVVQNLPIENIFEDIPQEWKDQMFNHIGNEDFLYVVISVAAVGDLDWFGAVREPDVMMDLHNSYYINGVAVAPY